MSYQVLARKWRPKNFQQVVGQAPILTALSNGLQQNRLHHAYLFSGTRGVGKTSIARLFAKGLNCINGISADPCGECVHCKAIEEGNFIDLIEIDAASRTKVEDTRELLDNVQYKPAQGRYKVYLIDEVHMLSRHSFNALLKTLEEPPEYVKFLLATTDPQKLPITILSRCIQFHLKALDIPQIQDHLAFVLQQENIPFEPFALEKLAKAAQGSIRDSLSLTDQAIAMSNGNITLDAVSLMLGLLDDNQPIDIVTALGQGNGEMLMQTIQAVAEKGGDWDELLRESAAILHKISLLQLLPATQSNEQDPLVFLAKHISPEDVQLFYQIILSGRKELQFAPNPRIGAEMTLLRALAFHPKLTTHQPNNAKPQSLPIVDTQTKNTAQQNTGVVNIPPSSVKTVSEVKESHTGKAEIEQRIANLRASVQSNHEKKKPASEIKHTVELPVCDSQIVKNSHSNAINHQALSATSTASSPLPTEISTQERALESAVENTQENEHEIDEDGINAENYQWEWTNPELENNAAGPKPSEIKQAILQERTPELTAKIIALSEQQSEWAALIGKLEIDRLVRQLALNSVLLSQSEQQMTLGLRTKQKHLNKPTFVESLTYILSAYFARPVQLNIELYDEPTSLTPMELCHQIYQQLSEQAKIELQQDPKILQFQREFNAELDLNSIRPV